MLLWRRFGLRFSSSLLNAIGLQFGSASLLLTQVRYQQMLTRLMTMVILNGTNSDSLMSAASSTFVLLILLRYSRRLLFFF